MADLLVVEGVMGNDFAVYFNALIVAGVCTTLPPPQIIARMQEQTKRDWFIAKDRRFGRALVGVEADEFDSRGRRIKWGAPIWNEFEDVTPPQPCPDQPDTHMHYILKSGKA